MAAGSLMDHDELVCSFERLAGDQREFVEIFDSQGCWSLSP